MKTAKETYRRLLHAERKIIKKNVILTIISSRYVMLCLIKINVFYDPRYKLRYINNQSKYFYYHGIKLTLFQTSDTLQYFFITTAGEPTAIEKGGILPLTTEFAPIMEPRPMLEPARTDTDSPSQTLSPINTEEFSLSNLPAGGTSGLWCKSHSSEP